jgi:hypothetical protein
MPTGRCADLHLQSQAQQLAQKLRELLPKVRDDRMHADFKAMLESHEENIRRAS